MNISLLLAMVSCVIMVALTVITHYEALRLITDVLLPRLRMRPRRQMIVVIFAVFLAHTVEVWLFAFAYAVSLQIPALGSFQGNIDGGLIDLMYFSAITYTSLGLGDIYPQDGLRLLTGVEALTGLLMIGWSASYTYLLMERLWRLHRPSDRTGTPFRDSTDRRDGSDHS